MDAEGDSVDKVVISMRSTKKINRKDALIAILIFTGLVFGTLFITGTIFSGYHLIDDHEIIRRIYNYEHSPSSFYQKFFAGFPWAGNRFRPLYTVVRKIRCYVLGDNFFLWYLVVGLEMVFAAFFAYLSARLFKCRHYMSVLFALLIIVGEQSAIWWRLGPQEPMGLLLLMLTIYLLQRYEVSENKRWLVAGIIFSVLCSWSKESFVLFLPFIPFLAISYDIFLSEQSQDGFWNLLGKSFRKNLLLILIDIVAFGWAVYQIVFKIGFMFADYAGIDELLGIKGYVFGIWNILNANLKIYFYGLIVLGVVLFLYSHVKKVSMDMCFNKLFLLLFTMLGAILFQLILYTKSGMWERYLIPAMLPIAVIAVIIVNTLFAGQKKLIRGYSAILMLIIAGLWITKVYPSGVEFANTGKAISDCFEMLLEEVPKESIIVSDLDDELNLSMESYLELELGYQSILSYDENNGVTQKVEESNAGQIIGEIGFADFIIGNKEEYDGFKCVREWSFGALWQRSSRNEIND